MTDLGLINAGSGVAAVEFASFSVIWYSIDARRLAADQMREKEGLNMGEALDDWGMFVKALAFAADKHQNQRRKNLGAMPYINHPIALANVLVNEGGVMDVKVLCAAALHDTIEDTGTTAQELAAIFGPLVAAIVQEVTDDKSLDKHVRKQMQIEHAPHLSKEAKLVKLADKICNLRDILASAPVDWSLKRKQDYFEWAGKVVAGVRGVHPGLEAVFDGLLMRSAELAD